MTTTLQGSCHMRLPDFILSNLERILAEWEVFARSVWPGAATDPLTLRDHAADILRATAFDMNSPQTPTQRSDKSKGDGHESAGSGRLNGASEIHAVGRVNSGFDLLAVIAEYRALRASVIRLWRDSAPHPDLRDLDDITRFNESIDQSLTEAVRSFTARVDRSRQMFLAILGHDLRNPLNSISLSAQSLAMTEQLDPGARRSAAQIHASTDAMSQMIADLLDFTGTGLGGAMPVAPSHMDIGDLCQQVVDEMRAGHPGRTLDLQTEGDLTGDWDSSRLRQVLSNLVANALHHGDAMSPITLVAKADGPAVLVTVHNRGPAIPPEALVTIFEPLVRGPVSSSRPRQHGSLGLGLYIARAIATAHGGTLNVASADEAGTTFTLRLPRTGARA